MNNQYERLGTRIPPLATHPFTLPAYFPFIVSSTQNELSTAVTLRLYGWVILKDKQMKNLIMKNFAIAVVLCLAIAPAKAGEEDSLKTKSYKSEYKIIGNASSLEIKVRGSVKVNDADTEVTAITPGGYLNIQKTTFGNKKELTISSNDAGKLSYEFYDNRSQVNYEPEGRKWLADVLLDVIRSTGVAAEDRVKRFYKRGGVDAVIDEIEEINSSSGKAEYFSFLLETNGLSEAALSKIALAIGKDIPSSSTRGELLRDYDYKFFSNSKSATAYFEAVKNIPSSSEAAYTLRHALEKHQLPASTKIALLQTVDHIASSSERGSVLRLYNRQFDKDERIQDKYFDVVDHIPSSSERGNVLRDLIREQKLDPYTFSRVLTSVNQIPSSSEQGSVLKYAIENSGELSADLFDKLASTISKIASSSTQGDVLKYAIIEKEPTPSQLVPLIKAVQQIPSSSTQGEVLRAASGKMRNDPALSDLIFETVTRIPSSSEQGNVLLTFMRDGNVHPDFLMKVIDASEHIASSSTRGEVLIKVTEVMPKNDTFRKAVSEAASKIPSSSEYRRVMEKLY
jgi:hypothetical protein